MLKTNKSIQLNGSSDFDGQSAMIFSANVKSDGNASLNATIVNQKLYDANKTDVQKDLSEFNIKAFSLSDEVDAPTGTSKEG
ncbi:hypothetical protein [Fructilactobacillus frigidiflavus]|uniref:hypothetical protein n=1 Tax=Fructilactobacillus frigidiflavus TaxID=3242688 RepID=UPI0037583A04